MPGKYALETKVPVGQTRGEIEALLEKYGADQFLYGTRSDPPGAAIGFRYANRNYRFLLPLPDEDEFAVTSRRVRRSAEGRRTAHAQACRSHWRSLYLIIKAKLEAVECGVSTFEDEFLAYTLLADGRTVSEEVQPAIRQIYETGRVLPLLSHLAALPEGK